MTTLARLTGLTEEYVERTDLRIEHWRFCTELLRDRGLTVGRIDGRFTGPLHSRIAENMDADPSIDAMEAPVHRGPAPLPAQRARQHPGPALRGLRQRDQGVVVQGVRGQADLRRRQARAGDARQPAPAGADRVRLLRPRHAVPRGRGHGRPPAAARRGVRPASSTSTSRPATCPTCTRRRASARPPGSPPSSPPTDVLGEHVRIEVQPEDRAGARHAGGLEGDP